MIQESFNTNLVEDEEDFHQQQQLEQKKHFECSKFIIMSHQSYFSLTWGFIDIILSLVSSYFYAWLAVFYDDLISDSAFNSYQMFFEIFFLFGMIKSFITDYIEDGEIVPVRDLIKIGQRYINRGSFLLDFITIFPFPYVLRNYIRKSKVFFLFKLGRMIKGVQLFQVTKLIS